MRSIKLTAALAVAAASLTLTCAVALALGHHPHGNTSPEGGGLSGDCRVNLELAPRPAYTGETVSAYGHLTCGGRGVEGQAVTLYQRPATSLTFTAVATGTTEKGGAYLVKDSAISVSSFLYVTAGSARSAVKHIGVVALVKLAGPPEGVLFTIPPHPGRKHPVPAVFTGEVTPALKGALVVLQRQNSLKGDEWHRIGLPVVVGEGGKFTIEHNFVVPGPANIRVVVHDPRVIVTSPSNVLTYEITQAQNPNLVIESLADPISEGQSTTIHGSVTKLAAGTPLELLAREAHAKSFTKVGETKVEAGGKYAFASVSPTTSTFYKVLGGGESSAVLYEGVKYVLTTTVSPSTTVQEGGTLTFSGTVKPGIAGHIIYLERENPANTGFHVIEVGQVLAPKAPSTEYTYSIEHKFFGVGNQVVRVKIPGDPQNGSTASEPFTIQVTTAPASSLTPVTPGNSGLPSEGQL